MNSWGLLFLAVGVFIFLGAISDWNWWWNNRRARLVSSLITKTGARVFYGTIGLAFTVLGFLGLFQFIDLKPPK